MCHLSAIFVKEKNILNSKVKHYWSSTKGLFLLLEETGGGESNKNDQPTRPQTLRGIFYNAARLTL